MYISSAAETPQNYVPSVDADGKSFDFALPTSVTNALIPGRARYSIRATLAQGITTAEGLVGPQTRTIAYGDFLVKEDPAKAVDRRSYNEICLADVSAAIKSRLSGTVMDEYTLNGVICKMPPLMKLQELKAFFESEVKREHGKPNQRSIPIKLVPQRGGLVPFGMNRRFR